MECSQRVLYVNITNTQGMQNAVHQAYSIKKKTQNVIFRGLLYIYSTFSFWEVYYRIYGQKIIFTVTRERSHKT